MFKANKDFANETKEKYTLFFAIWLHLNKFAIN